VASRGRRCDYIHKTLALDIGPGSSPVRETIEISPGDQQFVLNPSAINVFGATPSRAGESLWIALYGIPQAVVGGAG
jgi:hypothetical protein